MRRLPPRPSPASAWKPKQNTQTTQQNQNNQPPKITRPQPQIPVKSTPPPKQENEVKEIKQPNQPINIHKEEKIQTTPITSNNHNNNI